MLSRTLLSHRWIGKVGDRVQAFRMPAMPRAILAPLTVAVAKTEQLWQRINWRSSLLLGFALSLIYWIGLYGWMIAEVNFKAFRYAGF